MNTETKIKELRKQLFPTGRAWNYVRDAETREVIEYYTDGLGIEFTDGIGEAYGNETGSLNTFGKKVQIARSKSWSRFYDSSISILNAQLADNENFDTTDSTNWERVLGLYLSNLTIEERRAAILRKQAYPNGIPERAYYLFLQQQLRDAGFDVYVHENRFADGLGGWDVIDPDDLVFVPYELGNIELGVYEMGGGISGITYSIAANNIDESIDNLFFDIPVIESQLGAAELGSAQLKTSNPLERDLALRYTFFIGGQTFGTMANIPLNRKTEFRQLVLTLKHIHTVGFLLINYT